MKSQLLKKMMLAVMLSVFSFSFSLNAQSSSDSALVLQKCVDLTVLQQYYPTNPNNSFKPLVVMQHGITFSTSIAVSYANNPLVFKTKADIGNESAYFLFWEFKILGNSAKVEFTYKYDCNTPMKKAQKVTLVLLKTGNTWSVTSTNVETILL